MSTTTDASTDAGTTTTTDADPPAVTDPAGGTATTETDDGAGAGEGDHPDHDAAAGDTFSREYVTTLREEAANHRTRATDLAHQLWVERVAALSLLADPTDLPYDAEALADPAAIRRQAEELLERKPHLRTRKINGRAGQGEGIPGNGDDGVSLTGILRSHA